MHNYLDFLSVLVSAFEEELRIINEVLEGMDDCSLSDKESLFKELIMKLDNYRFDKNGLASSRSWNILTNELKKC